MTQTQRPLFIVGTQAEQAKIEEAGYLAQSIHGMEAGHIAGLSLELASNGRAAVILLCEGADAGAIESCSRAGVVSYSMEAADAEEYGRAVDAYPLQDAEALPAFLAREENRATERAEVVRAEAARRYMQELGVHDVFDVVVELAGGSADREHVPTGLQGLDKALDGGLQEGTLCTIGAMSSTGKTTLTLQVADAIAESGRPVLFVTVEQGRHELVSKSISRLMRLTPRNNGGHFTVSSWAIQSTKARAGWDAATAQAFTDACTHYSTRIAPNLKVLEMDRQPTTAEVRRAVESMMAWDKGKKPPIVIVDYLQLLAPADARMTERQAVDTNVMELRHLARDLHTIVIVVSSLNRASYSEGVTLAGLKESGAVEYGSDVVLGLQPRGFDDRVMGVAEGKRKAEGRKAEREYKGKTIREAEVKVLKNRGGRTPSTPIPLMYDAMCNLFTDDQGAGGSAGPTRRVK